MQISKNTIIKTLVASSLLLAAGLAQADTDVMEAGAALAAVTMEAIDIKQDLDQTMLQLQQQLKHDTYKNARQAITETAVTASNFHRLQH